METIIKKKIFSIFILIVIVLLLTSNVLGAKAVFNKFTNKQMSIIVPTVNQYDDLVQKYAAKTKVPANLIKAVMGVETGGVVPITTPYNFAGAIGLMQIVPMYQNGSKEGLDLQYSNCLAVGCMNTQVSKSLDKANLAENQEQIKTDYLDAENSICCASYILKQNYATGGLSYPPSASSCSNKRPQVVFNDWEAAVRRYNGGGCSVHDNELYYVERVMQLKEAFDNSPSNSKTYGTVSFVPKSKIELPTLISSFDELPKHIENLKKSCPQEDCIDASLDAWATYHHGSTWKFERFCESPNVNMVNYFYDQLQKGGNVTNTHNTSLTKGCKIKIADQNLPVDFLGSEEIVFTNINVTNHKDFTLQTSGLSTEFVSNPVYMEKSFGFFPMSFKSFYNAGNNTYDIILASRTINDIFEIYLMYEETGMVAPDDYKYKFFYRGTSSGGPPYYYYDDYGNIIRSLSNSSNTMGFDEFKNLYPDCDYEKKKFFYCLETGEYEDLYDWTKGRWFTADEALKYIDDYYTRNRILQIIDKRANLNSNDPDIDRKRSDALIDYMDNDKIANSHLSHYYTSNLCSHYNIYSPCAAYNSMSTQDVVNEAHKLYYYFSGNTGVTWEKEIELAEKTLAAYYYAWSKGKNSPTYQMTIAKHMLALFEQIDYLKKSHVVIKFAFELD